MSGLPLVNGQTARASVRALFESGAYVLDVNLEPSNFFTWKSGVRAPVYTDCRVIQGCSGAFRTIMENLVSSIRFNFDECDAIVGMAEAGIVWSAPVSVALAVPHAFVRKNAKPHGRGRMVEGSLRPGDQVVLVDDLVAGGGTICDAVKLIETETQARVIGIQTIVNWNFVEMRQRFSELCIPYRALMSFPQILDYAVRRNLITGLAAHELTAFYRDPRGHRWNLQNLRDEHLAQANSVA